MFFYNNCHWLMLAQVLDRCMKRQCPSIFNIVWPAVKGHRHSKVTCYIFATGAEGSLPDNIKVFEADVAMKTSKAAISASAIIVDEAMYPSSLSLATVVSSPNKPVKGVVLGRGILPKKLVKKC